MLLPGCTLFDPLLDEGNLLLGKFSFGFGRRHSLVRIVAGNSSIQFALFRVAGLDRTITSQVGQCTVLGIQSQIRLARLRVRAVALEASIREDRANVTAEVDFGGMRRGNDDRRNFQRD